MFYSLQFTSEGRHQLTMTSGFSYPLKRVFHLFSENVKEIIYPLNELQFILMLKLENRYTSIQYFLAIDA